MNHLWVIEGLSGRLNGRPKEWNPIWSALRPASAPTKALCLKMLRDQKDQTTSYVKHGIYSAFRVTKFVRVE